MRPRSPEDTSSTSSGRPEHPALRVARLVGPILLLLGSLAVLVVHAAGTEMAPLVIAVATFFATLAVALMVKRPRRP